MRSILILLLAALCASGAEACSTARLDRVLAAPPPGKPIREFDVGDAGSAEGGAWQVYGGGASSARQIVRTDFGEMGRTSLRLAVVAPGTYGLVRSTTHYTKPFTQPGFRIARVERRTYRFCDGELVAARGQDSAAAARLRQEAAAEKAVFGAAEIRPYLVGSRL